MIRSLSQLKCDVKQGFLRDLQSPSLTGTRIYHINEFLFCCFSHNEATVELQRFYTNKFIAVTLETEAP